MMPSRACARANAASKSRYFCTRFASAKTPRIGAVEKMSRNTAESMIVAGMVLDIAFGLSRERGLEDVPSELSRLPLIPAQAGIQRESADRDDMFAGSPLSRG